MTAERHTTESGFARLAKKYAREAAIHADPQEFWVYQVLELRFPEYEALVGIASDEAHDPRGAFRTSLTKAVAEWVDNYAANQEHARRRRHRKRPPSDEWTRVLARHAEEAASAAGMTKLPSGRLILRLAEIYKRTTGRRAMYADERFRKLVKLVFDDFSARGLTRARDELREKGDDIAAARAELLACPGYQRSPAGLRSAIERALKDRR